MPTKKTTGKAKVKSSAKSAAKKASPTKAADSAGTVALRNDQFLKKTKLAKHAKALLRHLDLAHGRAEAIRKIANPAPKIASQETGPGKETGPGNS